MGDIFLSEVYVPIPEPGQTASSLDRQASSINFTSISSRSEGTIKINISWGSNPIKVSPKRSLLPSDPLSFNGPAGLLNLQKMIEWILNTNIDPNNPRNTDLVGIRELVDSVVSDDNIPLKHWHSTGFFRAGLPKWLEKLAFGVGVKIC